MSTLSTFLSGTYSGYSGTSGYSGYSGFSGATGPQGASGYSGTSTSGYSGYSGISGYSGQNGASGYSGYSGAPGSSGTVSYIKKTANYTAAATEAIIADTSGGSFTITLPATPTLGDNVTIVDGASWTTNNLIIGRNGSTIEGLAENLTIDIPSIRLDIVYDGSTWNVTTSAGTAEIPSQTGNSGKYLTTNGSIVSWSSVDTFPSQTGNSGKYLTTDGSNVSWAAVILPAGQTSGSTTAGYLQYNGTTKATGQLDGGTTAPSNTTRLNYDGHFYATKFFGDGSGLTGAGATITDDTTTNGTRYILFDDATSGSATNIYVSSTKLYYNPSTGTLNATNFNSLSDLTLKENIVPLSASTDSINPIEFTWKDNNKKSFGLIAQDVEKVFPHIVETNDEGIKSVSYVQLIPILIKEIKELKEEIRMMKEAK